MHHTRLAYAAAGPRRPRRLGRLSALSALAFLAAGCTAAVGPPAPAPAVSSCDDVTPLFAADEVLADPAHACYDWLDATHGRVARSGSASAVVWTRRTTYGTGVLVSAWHILGAGWFGPVGEDVAATVHDATTATGVARITLVAEQGRLLDDRRTPMFDLYNPVLPATENAAGLTDIRPRHDFFLAIIDGQKLPEPRRLRRAVQPPRVNAGAPRLMNTPTPLYDPAGATTADPTFAGVEAAEIVLMLGYPQTGPTAGELTAGVGRVLDDAAADRAITDLAAVGDVEGEIAYDPEAEMIVAGPARSGMSGGGVFNRDGLLVGVLVRASDPRGGVQYVRIVRMSFIAAQFDVAFDAAPDELQQTLAPYVPAPE